MNWNSYIVKDYDNTVKVSECCDAPAGNDVVETIAGMFEGRCPRCHEVAEFDTLNNWAVRES